MIVERRSRSLKNYGRLIITVLLFLSKNTISVAFVFLHEVHLKIRKNVRTCVRDGPSKYATNSLHDNLLLDVEELVESSARHSRDTSQYRMIGDQEREFQMNVGRAVDTLRKDYPNLLTSPPDFSIYHDRIEVVDPSGVKLHSLKNYKTSFQFLHAMINLFYRVDQSAITFRLFYDCSRKSIRVSWNAILLPRSIMAGRGCLYVDGISVYQIERSSGLITQHRVEQILLNDTPVRVPQGMFLAIAQQANAGSVPVLGTNGGNLKMKFKNNNPGVTSLYFSKPLASSNAANDGGLEQPYFDRDAYDKKNASRKKFGLPPLTPDEFIELQLVIEKLDSAQREKAEAAGISTNFASRNSEKKEGILTKFFGNLLEDTCESNYDCERPEVCCDVGFKKFCCSAGMFVYDGPPQLKPIPAMALAGNPSEGGPNGMDNYETPGRSLEGDFLPPEH